MRLCFVTFPCDVLGKMLLDCIDSRYLPPYLLLQSERRMGQLASVMITENLINTLKRIHIQSNALMTLYIQLQDPDILLLLT